MKFCVALLICVSSSSWVIAAPITYTYSGNFSGSLGGISFFNQPTTIVGVGDTDTVLSTYAGYALTNPLSAIYVSVASVGSAAFLGYNDIFYTDLGPGLGINGTDLSAARDFLDSEYSLDTNYNLKTDLGPLPVTLAEGSGVFDTTVGQLVLSRADSIVTFASNVSEPSSLTLLVFGVVGAIVYRSRSYS